VEFGNEGRLMQGKKCKLMFSMVPEMGNGPLLWRTNRGIKIFKTGTYSLDLSIEEETTKR